MTPLTPTSPHQLGPILPFSLLLCTRISSTLSLCLSPTPTLLLNCPCPQPCPHRSLLSPSLPVFPMPLYQEEKRGSPEGLWFVPAAAYTGLMRSLREGVSVSVYVCVCLFCVAVTKSLAVCACACKYVCGAGGSLWTVMMRHLWGPKALFASCKSRACRAGTHTCMRTHSYLHQTQPFTARQPDLSSN